LKENKLKRLIKDGGIGVGPFMKITDPAVMEIAGYAGFNFVIIDTEHGPVSIETAQNLVRAATYAEITPIIRVKNNDPATILRALDIGAEGVEVPHISSKEDAVKAVRATKFAPVGERGVCRFVRAAQYSALDRFKYFETANKETMVILHIEGVEGINNLEKILSVEGVDIIFIGPYDLSQSLGLPGQVNHPLVTERMNKVISSTRKKGVAVGTFADDVETARKWINLGVQYIGFSVDVGIFYEACKEIVMKIFSEKKVNG
jgi:4-hydroxy-2-oxoheptanedioate aldolase